MSPSHPEGGGGTETRRRPHEQCISDALKPALLSALEAHRRAVPRSGCVGLERVPVSWCGRWGTKGQAQRQLQARAIHKRGRADTPYSVGPAASLTSIGCGPLRRARLSAYVFAGGAISLAGHLQQSLGHVWECYRIASVRPCSLRYTQGLRVSDGRCKKLDHAPERDLSRPLPCPHSWCAGRRH